MNKTITLTYSEELVKKSVVAFWQRTLGVGFFVALLALLGGFVLLLVAGNHSWYVGVLGTVLIFGVIFAIALFLNHYRSALKKLRQMHPAQATLQLSDSGFVMTSTIGTSQLTWAAVTDVWQFPTFWLLFFSKAQFVTIPLETLSQETRSFVEQNVRNAGGKVA